MNILFKRIVHYKTTYFMLCQNFYINNREAFGLPYHPYHVMDGITFLMLLEDQFLYLDLIFTKQKNVMVFADIADLTFGFLFNDDSIITKIQNRVYEGYGLINWDLPYTPEFFQLFHELRKTWSRYTDYCSNNKITDIDNGLENLTELLGEFKIHDNIRLVIQLLEGLMSE